MRISVPVMNAPSSDTSIANTPRPGCRRCIDFRGIPCTVTEACCQPGSSSPRCLPQKLSTTGDLSAGKRNNPRSREYAIMIHLMKIGDFVPVTRRIRSGRIRPRFDAAHGHAAAYTDFKDRYRDTARSLEFDRDIAWVEAMPSCDRRGLRIRGRLSAFRMH